MLSFISSHLSDIITAATIVGGYIFHRSSVTTQSTKASLVASAIATVEAVIDSYVQTTSGQETIANLKLELKGMAAVQLGRLGIYEGTTERTLIDAAVDAAIAAAVNKFVSVHPMPQTLNAQLKAG